MKNIVAQYQDLSKEWAKGSSRNNDTIRGLLSQLKISLTALSFLPTSDQPASIQELTVCRDTLEIGAQFAVTVGDIPMFERYIAQLQTYYYDYSSKMTDSVYKCQLLGLNLMCLLSQNRVAEFHTELERLPSKELNDIYIKTPISLEQYIMEGSYNKVLLLKENVPAESFGFFFDILLVTVRNEIASCLEKAYKEISCRDAARMLNLPESEMAEYAKNRNWPISHNNKFQFRSESQVQEEGGVPSQQLAKMAISYAREMEQIV